MREPKTVQLCEACGLNKATAISIAKDRCCQCWVAYYLAKRGISPVTLAAHPIKSVLDFWVTNEDGTVERLRP